MPVGIDGLNVNHMGMHIIGRADEIPVGGRRILTVDGREIGVFNVGGRLFALLNDCAHLGGPVCTGEVMGKLTAEVLPDGEMREFFTQEGEIVACPWHGWEFEIPTGAWLADPRFRLQTFSALTPVPPGATQA
jgi:3-phenylpropionate/trans-cinnamate dioxygenase ferredoxin subunit